MIKIKTYKNILEFLILWLVCGMAYYTLEGLWHIPLNGGNANISMMFVGGFAGALIGIIYNLDYFKKLNLFNKMIIGALIITIIEFVSGYILNIKLNLSIWDYSNLTYNFMGQISLMYTFLWFLIIPIAIWFNNYIRDRIL